MIGMRNDKLIFGVLTAGLFLAFTGQLVYHSVRISATVDEPFHVLAGHRHWQCGDFGINPEHPPLLKMLAAAPLNFRELSEPPWECGSKMTPKFDGFSYGASFLVENEVDRTLIAARLASALMSLLLVLLVFLAAWEMFGPWEALTALAIVAFEPNLIGQGSLVTTDMAISATSFAAMYALYRYGKDQTWLRFLVAGLAFGLLLAAKHSAVIFVGIFFIVTIADAVFFRTAETRQGKNVVGRATAFVGIFLIGFTILWSFYGFRYRAIPNADAPTISVADHIRENGRPEVIGSLSARITDTVSRLHVFPESYVLGMADVISWGSRNTVLFGQNYPTGKWFFFPIAFLVKTNIALLLLIPIGLLFLWFVPEKRREGMYVLAPAAAFLVFASSSSFTTHIRHILPVYALLAVLAAAGAVWLCRRFDVFRYVLGALLILNSVSAVRTAPYYLTFVNDFWGGYENAHRLTHSDDVGQSMKFVTEYLERENINDCWISFLAHPEMIESIQPCRPMPSVLRILVGRNLIDPVPPVIEGTVILGSRELPPFGADEYIPVTRTEPIALIGGNTFVYRGRFEVPLAAAISRFHRANHFLRVNDPENALIEARQAVELAPQDPRPHLVLGLALDRTGDTETARRELETAAAIAATDPRLRNMEVRARQELSKLK
jgi:hypothetical protein